MKEIVERSVTNMVQSMRQIRDEISDEIKNMSFEEERKFLDELLKTRETKDISSSSAKKASPSTK